MDATFQTTKGQAAVVAQRFAGALIKAIPKAHVRGGSCNTNLKPSHIKLGEGQLDSTLGSLADASSELAAPFLHIRSLGVALKDVTTDPNKAVHVYYEEDDNQVGARIRLTETEAWRPDILDKVVEVLATDFPFRQHESLALELTSPETRQVLRAYENALSMLGTNVSQLGTFLTEQQEALSTFLRERTVELEKRYAEKERLLEEEIAGKRNELESKEVALQQRTEAIDARDRTTTRRDLLKKIRDILDQQKNVSVSAGTSEKRRVITLTCLAVMAIGAALAGRAAWVITVSGFEWSHGVPMSGGILLFASTVVFYLRWNDAWFRDHARAEFRAMKTHADILRASWVAELYFEWTETKQTEFPSVLAERLTQNLFTDDRDGVVEHPADQVFKALRHLQLKAGNLELNTSGAKPK